jgi:predicted nucleic acid-binding Zn ribbon protein
MNCPVCGRELREDSKFCDWCSSPVQKPSEAENRVLSFNHKALILGIFFSLLLTLIISGAAKSLGLPLLFGGLFLPFFFSYKRVKKS